MRCAGWGEPERLFFTASFDSDIQKIGTKFEIVDDFDTAIYKVASGTLAFYENNFFLLDAIVQYINSANYTSNGKAIL